MTGLRAQSSSSFARPELLASTDWVAAEMNRGEVRILDVRWRPDGSGHQAFEDGHIPGAVHVDWRAGLTPPSLDAEGASPPPGPPAQGSAAISRPGRRHRK